MIKSAKQIRIILLFLIGFGLLLYSCDDAANSNSGNNAVDQDNWLIPQGEVVDGGPGKDGIPSIDNPKFANASSINFIPDDRRVIGIKIGNEIKVYPHQIMDWHEIVNDDVGDEPIALTFCPLTGTALAWSREVNGNVTEFGVSGLLFRNNLIPYDRSTDSNWSQMQIRSVAGSLAEVEAETFQVVETTWETWKKLYPESMVLTTETGFNRNYSVFTYGEDYSTNHDRILFPITNTNNTLPRKERVHGVLPVQDSDPSHGVPTVYPINEFGEGISVISDVVNGKMIAVVGSANLDFAATFYAELADGTNLQLKSVNEDMLPVVMTDQEGNEWDIFGNAVSGPRTGQKLQAVRSFTGYWFGWADFYPDLNVFQQNSE